MESATACVHRALRMIVSLSLVVLVLPCFGSSSSSSSSPPKVSFLTSSMGESSDRMALLAFKSSLTSDPHRALPSWNETFHFCRWRGVMCGGRRHPDRVTELNLQSLNLSGPIPTSVAELTFLRRLDLSNNSFHGQIPEELDRLSRLRHLNMSSNSLTGRIPMSLSNLSLLQYLSLGTNRLEGAIPPQLGNLSLLERLYLDGNILSGSIPSSLGNLSSLQRLYLRENHLTGSIPPSLGGLTSLKILSLETNNLTGGIPPSLGNLTSLTMLVLKSNSLAGAIPYSIGDLTSLTIFRAEYNKLTGKIPSSIYNLSLLVEFYLLGNQFSGSLSPDIGTSLPDLQDLNLAGNQFQGSIPSSIDNASALRWIDLSDNKFNGVLPSRWGHLKALTQLGLENNQLEARDDGDWSFLTSLANCTRLQVLQLSKNRLTGVLPRAISNLSTELNLLDLEFNQIRGSIPEGIGSLIGLTILDLGNNHLTGTIPVAIGKLQKLVFLALSGNQFSGQLPSLMFNLTQLNTLHLGRNNLQGAIPPSLGKLQYLLDLNLSYNKFTGIIPKELFSISSLSISLDLSHNSISGTLPAEVGHLINLSKMDVSQNNLSGKIPSTLGDCVHLEYLLMQGNAFEGVIPQSFSKLGGLQGLNLSHNSLSGKIPELLRNFRSLNYLDLSFNNFDGEVPKGGIFDNASAVSVTGNYELCGGIPGLQLRACSSGEYRGHRRYIILAIIVTFSGAVLGLLILIFSRFRKRESSQPTALSNDPLPRTTYSEIFNATGGFSSQNLIGIGSFGSVYRAKMNLSDLNGSFVAVKVINLQQQGASKSFMAECEALRNIRHRNLLRILTSCSSIDFDGNDFKALVFEFMPKGSLDQWLHPIENEDSKKHLSLMQRLNIAVDVASALVYLHHHTHKSIVHCDLKPSNVLLNNDMTAHVSDFGLARFLKSKDDKSQTGSLTFRGSIGYVAPEYGMGCNPSTKGDVFSYGVLLLEMITNRRPTDASFEDELTLQKFVEMAFPEHVLNVVDPNLMTEENNNAYNISQARINDVSQGRITCLVSMARLGLMCLKESPKERMGMEAVAKEMTMIRDTFLRVAVHEGINGGGGNGEIEDHDEGYLTGGWSPWRETTSSGLRSVPPI